MNSDEADVFARDEAERQAETQIQDAIDEIYLVPWMKKVIGIGSRSRIYAIVVGYQFQRS